jgi:hypothetical protein
MGGNEEVFVLENWLTETEEEVEGEMALPSRLGGPELLPMVERLRGRFVGATVDRS